jgi:hypothetical protein
LVLVGVHSDNNRLWIEPSHLVVDAKGDLRVRYLATLLDIKNPTTCSYLFALINRDGIKSVNGNSITQD